MAEDAATPSGGHDPTRLLRDSELPGTGTPPTHATAPMAGSRLASGERIGDYVLRERLGHGGMGEVWRAEQVGLQRQVALKLMLRWSATAWARFEREAKLAAGLDHPHIARLYDFSHDPPFIAMQLISGRPLTGTSERSIRALRDAALAVEHAHSRGVLHRDLKPDNIVVDDAGDAYVLDFGLALPVEAGNERLTLAGEIVGTPSYMAPEQARGDAHAIGRRSDVYGLGATLYALLANRPPFHGSGAWQVLHRVIDEEPERPGGDRDLETICLCAMAKDPSRRYASARAFAEDLDRWLAREPVRARRAGILYRLTRAVQRRPAVWALGAAFVGALAIGGAFGVVQLARANAALAHALALERRDAAVQMEHARQLELEGEVEQARRTLRDADDELSRSLDDAQLGTVLAQLQDMSVTLDRLAQRWPREGIIPCLAGEVALLRNQEGVALAAFDRALAGATTPLSSTLGVEGEAHLGRALARLRRDFLDQMGRLFIFEDESGYMAVNDGAAAIEADLDAAGTAGDGYEREVLGLWARYLRAASSLDAFRRYTEVHDQALALAKRGGRHDEYVHLLVGVVDGSPTRLASASAEYTLAIERAHSLPQAWLLRALERALWPGHDDEARLDCDQALRLRPDYALARLLRAQVDDAHPQAELADANEAVRLAPQQPQCYVVRAHLRQAQEPAGALADLRQAVAIATERHFQRGMATYRWSLAELERQLGLRAEAIATYRSVGSDAARLQVARLLEPDAAAGSHALGDLLDETPPAQRLEAALQAHAWRARVRADAGDHQGALADWRWVAARAPHSLRAHTGEAEALARLGQTAQARATLDQAILASAPQASSLVAAGAPGASAATEAGAQALTAALVARARVRAADGDVAGANADLAEALRRQPDAPEALAQRATLRRTSGDGAGAAADDARRIAALLAAADAHRARGEFADAADLYHTVLTIDPQQPAARTGMQAIAAVEAAVH